MVRHAPGVAMHRLLLIAVLLASACASSPTVQPLADPVPQTEVLRSVLELSGGEVDGIRLRGLSGLAVDATTDTLYALSDFGALFIFALAFDDTGDLADASPQRAVHLKGEDGRRLRFPYSDAEGLVLIGQGPTARLLVSFEQRPRVAVFDLQGRQIESWPLPPDFDHASAYANRNKSLESIGLDDAGKWLALSEGALAGDDSGRRPLLDAHGLRAWYHPGPAPASAPVSMEVLSDDGGLLVLERAYAGPLQPLVISVRRARLPAVRGGLMDVEDVLVMSTAEDWPLDNLEGMTRLPSGDLLLVSDDNGSVLQRTLLLHVRLP